MKGALSLRIRPDGTNEHIVLLDVKQDEYRRFCFEFEDGEIWKFSQWITDIPLPDIHEVCRLDACGKQNVPRDPHVKRVLTEIILWPYREIRGWFQICQPIDAKIQMLEKALHRSVPPSKNPWWINLQIRYENQSGRTKREKWAQVAHIVRMAADGQRHEKEPRCDYLKTRMLKNLMKRLTTVKDTAAFEMKYGETLSRSFKRAQAADARRASK